MSTNAEKIKSGEDVGVDVGAIEREFAGLWHQAGEDAHDTSNKPVTRACLANLLVWVDREEMLAPLKSAFEQLVVSVPARVLVLQVEDAKAGAPEFESYISANCILAPGGGKLVCSEEVTLVARGDGTQHLGSVVRALLVPNVPIMALLSEPPARGAETANALVPLIDRLLVDSGAVRDVAQWKALGKIMVRAPEVVDLGWMALSSFRSALSSVFDHHEPRTALEGLREVSLVAPKSRLAGRILLLGWLADRLQWSAPVKQADGGVKYASPHGPVTVRVGQREAVEGKEEPATELLLTTSKGNIRLCRGKEPHVVVESLGHDGRAMALDPSTLGERIARAMGPRAPDALYTKAWKRSAELLGILGLA